jgi:hypothetical protein
MFVSDQSQTNSKVSFVYTSYVSKILENASMTDSLIVSVSYLLQIPVTSTPVVPHLTLEIYCSTFPQLPRKCPCRI